MGDPTDLSEAKARWKRLRIPSRSICTSIFLSSTFLTDFGADFEAFGSGLSSSASAEPGAVDLVSSDGGGSGFGGSFFGESFFGAADGGSSGGSSSRIRSSRVCWKSSLRSQSHHRSPPSSSRWETKHSLRPSGLHAGLRSGRGLALRLKGNIVPSLRTSHTSRLKS